MDLEIAIDTFTLDLLPADLHIFYIENKSEGAGLVCLIQDLLVQFLVIVYAKGIFVYEQTFPYITGRI
jgi:hypothetical protein